MSGIISSKSFDANALTNFINGFKSNPNQEIPFYFIHSLKRIASLVSSLSIQEIMRNHTEIPSILIEILHCPQLCAHIEVSELIADSLLSFVMCGEDKPMKWATNHIIKNNIYYKKTVNQIRCTKNQFLKVLNQNPEEYIKTLTNDSLLQVALANPGNDVLSMAIQEMDDRGIEFPYDLYYNASLVKLSPKIFMKCFLHFLNAPTIKISSQIIEVFMNKPTLHPLCIKEAIKFPLKSCQIALEMIGKMILLQLKQKSFCFPLSIMYHPSISDFVDEIERGFINQNNDINQEFFFESLHSINFENIPFLIPLLMEFPGIKDFIQQNDEEYFNLVLNVQNSMFSS